MLLSAQRCNKLPTEQLRKYSAYQDSFFGPLGICKSGDRQYSQFQSLFIGRKGEGLMGLVVVMVLVVMVLVVGVLVFVVVVAVVVLVVLSKN